MVEKKQIEKALIAEISTILACDENELTPDTTFESLGIDSIRLVELLIFIEKEYGIRLMDAGLEAGALRNIASLSESVEKALNP